MAIFSSNKKNKKDQQQQQPGSPPLGASQSSQASNSAFPRSASGGNVAQQAAYDAPPPSNIPTPSGVPPAATGSAAAPPLAVLYPWSQRPLSLLPAALLPPIDPSNPTAPPQPIAGPLSPPPFPRYGHSVNPVASSSTGHLYIFGGLVQNAVKNDLYVLNCNAVGSSGSQGVPLGVGIVETRGEVPGQRVGHASVGVGNVLIVWGGDTKSRPEDRQDDGLYLLNLSTKEWTRVKTIGPNPEGRYGHAAAMVGSKFFIFGGQKDDGGFMNDLVWFDLQKLKAGQPKWTFVDYAPGAIAPPKRTGHTTVTHGDCIYVFGGTDGQYHYNDTWCYDTNSGIWVELSCIGYIPVPREGHAATLVDDVMYVFGGRGVDGKDLEDLAAFKITNQRWFMFQNMGPAPSGRSGHAMATFQNKVLVLGGESYTSQRADDPSFVHVLDTSKIKYPADTTRQPQQPVSRKSSIPIMAGSPALNGSVPPSAGGSPAFGTTPEEEAARRAASPTGSQRKVSNGANSIGLGQPNSFGQIGQQAQQQQQQQSLNGRPPAAASKIAKRATTGGATVGAPTRPARPDEELGTSTNRRTMDPSSAPRYDENRSMSPTGAGALVGAQQPRIASAGSRTVSPGLASPTTSSASGRQGGSNKGTPPLAQGGFAGQQAASAMLGRAASPSQHPLPESIEGHELHPSELSSSTTLAPVNGASPPQDAFYYGSRGATTSNSNSNAQAEHAAALKAKEEEIAQLQNREAWMRKALSAAVRKGFVPLPSAAATTREGEGLEGEGEGEDSFAKLAKASEADEGVPNKEVVEALLAVKRELAKAKTDLAEQAQSVDERIAGATRARTAALQEASYYRAKLAAVESGNTSDVTKLERERSSELERKLAEALEAKSALERQVSKLEEEVGHHSEMRSATEERHSAATVRADAAESSYSRALTDYAELQRRAHGHESTIQDHLEKIATLTSTSSQHAAENAQLKEQLETANSSVTTHLRTLGETQLALTAAGTRNDEIHSIWEASQKELNEHQSRAQQLQADLDAKHLESTAATARAADLERVLKSTRESHLATQALATGGLAALLAKKEKKPTATRSIGTDGVEGDEAEEEEDDDAPSAHHAQRLRAIEEESATFKQLHADTRSKSEATLTELAEVRAREVSLQGQVIQLRQEIATLRSQHTQALDEVAGHKKAHSTREGELRGAAKAREAAEVKAGLLRNVMSDHGLTVSDDELATRFPPMTGSETPEQLHRRVQELEGRLEQRTKAHQELSAQQEDLVKQREEHVEELERLRNAEPVVLPEHVERATKAEEELEALQGRHKQLEGTHLKAVQYVKGTEKMLRRMKEELTRYKERCEELESPDRALPAEHVAELEGLRSQVTTLTSSHDQTRSAHEDLQRQFATIQADHHLAQGKTKEMQAEIARLDQELEKANHDLEETLAVNASLNTELTAALKNPTSPRSATGTDDLGRVEAELTQAQNKAEWLKRENAQLEERCRTAESKIAILLDHLEGAGDETVDNSPDHDGTEFDSQPWNRVGAEASDADSDYSGRGAAVQR